MRVVLLLVFFTLSCHAAEENKMEDKVRNKLIDAVHNDFGWKKEDVRINEVERLRRGSCSFYTAGHLVRPIAYQPNYAVLGGEEVLNASKDSNVAKMIDTCGADAPAGWWAEIITRFHPELGSGVVLQDAQQNDAAVRKIVAAGKEFAPPKLSGDAKNRTITYYLLDPESFVIYTVKAARNPDNTFSVTKQELE